MSLIVTCPACGGSFDLREARNDQIWREFVALLVQLPAPVQPVLLQYIELFRPAQQTSVRSSTALKVASELLPLIKAQRLERKHARYDVSTTLWTNTMSYLVDKRQSLQLPLKGNGYLLETIANQCEKQAAKVEAQALQTQRHTPRPVAPATPMPSYVQAALDDPKPNGFSQLAEVIRQALNSTGDQS